MLALVLEAGAARYGIGASEVIEVVPMLVLRAIPHAPPSVVGLFTYRGTTVPVVDLSLLLGGKRTPDRLSSRIVVTKYTLGKEMRPLGLAAERVLDVEDVDEKSAYTGLSLPDAPYLGKVVQTGGTMTQLVRINKLLPQEIAAILFAEATAEKG
jgi:chemotaxis-related protein WspB